VRPIETEPGRLFGGRYSPTTLDSLPPEVRDLVEHVLSHVMLRTVQQVGNFAMYVVRKLADRGVDVDISYSMERFRRSVVLTVTLELKDIDLKLVSENSRYFFTKSATDKWAKWAFVKTASELAKKLVDSSIKSYVDSYADEEEPEGGGGEEGKV